jgi:PAS domain S-box-containing protein
MGAEARIPAFAAAGGVSGFLGHNIRNVMSAFANLIPPNEAERLAALRECCILDTEPEAAFDDLARLCAQLCEVPMAVVALVDAERVWLKARVGVDMVEFPRARSLASLAVLQPQLFAFSDIQTDPALAGHPLVAAQLGVRFFACQPLVLHRHIIGGLCVMDRRAGQLRPEQSEALAILGRQVVVQLELRQKLRQHEEAEQALRAAEHKYRDIFENVVEGIFQTTPDGHYLAANARLAQIYGYASPEELIAAVSNIGHQLYVEAGRREEFIQAIQRDGEVHDFESRVYRRDGSIIWIAENARVVRDAAGAVLYYEGTVEDITARREAEDARRNSELLYHSLVELLPQSLFRKDTGSRFTFVNRHFCDALKLEPNEIIGRTDFDFFPAPLAEQYRRDDQEVMRTLQPREQVEENVLPDGSRRYVHVIKTPLFDNAGRVIGVQGMFWDETERRRTEEALAHERDLLRALLEAVPDSIYFKDANSKFLRCSRAMAEKFHVADPEQLIGKSDFDFFSQEHAQAAYEDEQRIVRTGQALPSFKEKETWPDGTETWVLTSKMPLRNEHGEVIGSFGMSKDITDLVRAEEDLKQAHAAAVELANAKAQFLANMSHEIRTPLNAIIGMTGLLLDSELRPEQRDCAETVRESGEALLEIIDNILDLSRVEAGRMTLESVEFDLREVVEKTTELLADRAQAKGLEFVCWMDPEMNSQVTGDPTRLRQVLMNLIGNAIKFTERGEVVLKVATVLETARQLSVRFEVQDTGIGITAEARERIFQPFVQADGSTTRRFGGTGLGLSISRQLVELMGGQIEVRSQAGAGTTFAFELSFPRPADAAATAPALPAGLAGKRVLLVDDSASSRVALASQLTAWGVEVAEAATAPDAMSLLQTARDAGQPFDLALVDMEMPETDGIVLTEAIRSDPANDRVRIALLVWLRNRPDLTVLRALGINACLIKPVRRSRLLTGLLNALQDTPPAASPPAATPAPAAPPPAEGARLSLRVLVVEDNSVNRKLALQQLHKLGYTGHAVSGGLAALAELEREPYDLLLLDCQMPEMDGYETARRLRQVEGPATAAGTARRPLHIIAMTANALEGDREKCLAAGMDDYVSKPVRLSDLEAALRRGAERLLAGTPPRSPAPAPARPAGPVPAAAALALANLPTLDREAIEALRGLAPPGEPDPLPEFIGLFQTEARAALEKIRAAVNSGDAAALRNAAHNLKGCASNLGARRLAAVAEQLEKRARTGDAAVPAEWLRSAEDEHARVTHALVGEARPA